jgi:hypothetical protein
MCQHSAMSDVADITLQEIIARLREIAGTVADEATCRATLREKGPPKF